MPYKLYYIVKDSIIIFFYVDDIIIAYNKKKTKEVEKVTNLLREKYTITRGVDL